MINDMKLLKADEDLVAFKNKLLGIILPKNETPSTPGAPSAVKMIYTKEMVDSQWLRLAKITDISNNSSGIFTFNCYAYDEEDNLTQLSSSVFGASCGINAQQQFISDVMAITQSPEIQLKGASAPGGTSSGEETGSGEVGSGEASSGEPSSGEGGSGETGSGSSNNLYGLNSIKFEWYKEELYLCGLIGFPSVEVYKGIQCEMLIENNLNFEHLEDLEIVDFSLTEEEGLNISEGMELQAGDDFEVRLSCTFAEYLRGIEDQEPIEYVFKSGEKELPIIKYNYDGNQFPTGNFDWDYRTYENYLVPIGNWMNYSVANFSGVSGPGYSDDVKVNILERYKHKEEYFVSKATKLSGKIEASFINCNVKLKINDMEYEITPEDVFELKLDNVTKDDIELSYTVIEEGYYTCFVNFIPDMEKSELEISIPFEMKENFLVEEIHNNSGFDFDIRMYELFKHETTNVFSLYSAYRKHVELEREIDGVNNKLNDVKREIEAFDERLEDKLSSMLSLVAYLNLEEIPDSQFNYKKLPVTRLTFPNAKKIGSYAFYQTNLKRIELPEVLEIGDGAFYEAPNISEETLEIIFPKIQKVGSNAFNKLTYVYVPSTLTEIGNDAFGKRLEEVYVDGNNPKYDSREDCQAIIETSTNTLIQATTNTWIPDSVEIIGSRAFEKRSIEYFYGYNIKKINDYAFSDCSNLTNVYLPKCNYLESYAFYFCTNLTSVDLPMCTYVGTQAFDGCLNLTSISLPICSNISGYAFNCCTNLSQVFIPVCDWIGNGVFYGCENLTTVELLTYSAPQLNYNAFYNTPLSKSTYLGYYGSIYVPAGAVENFRNATNWTMYADRITQLENDYTSEYIYGYEFTSSTLTEIPQERNSVIAVGNGAFTACSNLTSVSLPMCKYVGAFAFNGCTNLTSASLPMCGYVGSYAFGYCKNLTSVDLTNCNYIESGAFDHCSKLTNVDLPQCSYVGNEAFYYCSNLTSASLPMCGYVGSSAFRDCSNLTTVELPNCEYIAYRAFLSCTNLTSIDLTNCSYIGNQALYGCSNLTTISLPQCENIHGGAFYGCYNLQTMYLNVSSVPTLGTVDAFSYTPLSDSSYLGYYGSIYVPYSLYEAFKTATNWAAYADRFVSYF